MNVNLDAARARAASVLSKIRWGGQVVGYPRTAMGAARLASLRIRRPAVAQVVLRSGGTIVFDYPGQMAPALVVFGDVIDPELLLLPALLAPGSVVLDAGAAIGQFTVVAGRIDGVTLHSYEPSSANMASLQRNIDLNGLTARVTVHRAALSSQPGEATFHTSANTYLSGLGAAAGGGAEETVPVRTVDAELERLGVDRLDLLKVNVAGYESDVLRGALESFSRGKVGALIVLIGEAVIPVLEEVRALGYGFYFFIPRTKTLHPVSRLTAETLTSPPTPARHVIGLSRDSVEALRRSGVRVSAA